MITIPLPIQIVAIPLHHAMFLRSYCKIWYFGILFDILITRFKNGMLRRRGGGDSLEKPCQILLIFFI